MDNSFRVAKHKNPYCDKSQNSNYDKTQISTLLKNSYSNKTHKLKL